MEDQNETLKASRRDSIDLLLSTPQSTVQLHTLIVTHTRGTSFIVDKYWMTHDQDAYFISFDPYMFQFAKL